jgi:hypothetical protein
MASHRVYSDVERSQDYTQVEIFYTHNMYIVYIPPHFLCHPGMVFETWGEN